MISAPPRSTGRARWSVDRVKGLGFEMSIQGSGIASIGEVDVDQMKVGVSGAGTIRMAGRVGKLSTTIRGTSTLEADRLEVKDAVIGAEGPSTVRAQVTNSAKVDAIGLASVTLTGRPRLHRQRQGLGQCRRLQGRALLDSAKSDQRERRQLAVEPRRKFGQGRCRHPRRSARPHPRDNASPGARASALAGSATSSAEQTMSIRPSLRSSNRRICWRAIIRCLTIQWSEPPTSSSIRFGRIRVGTRTTPSAVTRRAMRFCSASRLAQPTATLVR